MELIEVAESLETYEVKRGFELPDLERLAPSEARVDELSGAIEDSYFDTADRELLELGITLHLRAGEYWELTVPTGTDRTTFRRPFVAGPGLVPREVADLTLGARRGHSLGRTVTIRTERAVYRLVGADGAVLLEVADNQLHSAAPGEQSVRLERWREVELRTGPSGSAALQRAASKRLRKAGAVPVSRDARVAKALGAAPARTLDRTPRHTRTAGALIQRYLAEQDDALVAGDLQLRLGADAIHGTRIATRRMRSAARVFAPFLDAALSQHLDAELAWFGRLLGNVRDAEVQRARLIDAIEALPEEQVLGDVTSRIEEHLAAEKALHQAALDAAMRSPRYLSLLIDTARWAVQPPLTEAAGGKPDVLAKSVAASAKKVRTHLRAGLRSADEEELHKARKSGKRARYAAELAAPGLGAKTEKSVAQLTRLQKILGEHQDSIVASELVRRLAATSSALPGESSFTLGVLHATEARHTEKSLAKARRWAKKH